MRLNLRRVSPRVWIAIMVLVLALGVVPAQAMAYSPWSWDYTQAELDLIARTVYAEAAG